MENLALSIQVRNALRRNGIEDLSSLVARYYGEGLSSCVRIGRRAIEEIGAFLEKINPDIVKTSLYGVLQGELPQVQEAADPAGAWPLKIDPGQCRRIAVETLGLPARIRNVLRRNGIDTLFSLAARYYGDGLASCVNIGERTIGEIGLFLRRINDDITTAFLPSDFQAPPEPVWPLRVDPERCGEISVESLELSSRSKNALIRNGIYDLRALITRYYNDGLMSCFRIGERTAAEVSAFLKTLTAEALLPETGAAPDLPQDILRRPVKDLKISLNATRAFQRMRIETIGQALAISEEEGFGQRHQRLQEQLRQLKAMGERYFSASAFDIDLIKTLQRDYGFKRRWLSQWLGVSNQWVSKALRKTVNRGRWRGAPLAEEDRRVFEGMTASRRYRFETAAKKYVVLNNQRDDAALLTVAGKEIKCWFLADLPEGLRAALVNAEMHRRAE